MRITDLDRDGSYATLANDGKEYFASRNLQTGVIYTGVLLPNGNDRYHKLNSPMQLKILQVLGW